VLLKICRILGCVWIKLCSVVCERCCQDLSGGCAADVVEFGLESWHLCLRLGCFNECISVLFFCFHTFGVVFWYLEIADVGCCLFGSFGEVWLLNLCVFCLCMLSLHIHHFLWGWLLNNICCSKKNVWHDFVFFLIWFLVIRNLMSWFTNVYFVYLQARKIYETSSWLLWELIQFFALILLLSQVMNSFISIRALCIILTYLMLCLLLIKQFCLFIINLLPSILAAIGVDSVGRVDLEKICYVLGYWCWIFKIDVNLIDSNVTWSLGFLV